MLSDADLHNLTMDSDATMRLVARELELARKAIRVLRVGCECHGQPCQCSRCIVLREYDAGETSEAPAEDTSQQEAYEGAQPHKPTFAEALEFELSGRSDGSHPMSWAAMWACVERARRASGE